MKNILNRIIYALLIAIIISTNIYQSSLARGVQSSGREQNNINVQSASLTSYSITNPNLCPSTGERPHSTLFFDNMENGSANWDFQAGSGSIVDWSIIPSGIYGSSLYGVDTGSQANDTWAAMHTGITLSGGTSYYLYFYHRFSFEYYQSGQAYDGGALEYTTDGTWHDAGALFSDGQNYNATIMNNYSNPLQGRAVFSSESGGVVASRYNLSSLAGQTVRFRWRIGTDTNVQSGTGWQVDDVRIYTCSKYPLYDFNGNGTTDITIFRPSNGLWAMSGIGYAGFGMAGDIPVPADYNGDGITDIAIFRPSNGLWAIKDIGYYVYGMAGDVPVPADYNGDGITDIAIFRPSNGLWAIKDIGYFAHGMNGDIPVPADYNGDGKAEVAIFRPSNGLWAILNGTNGVTYSVYGMNGDIPVPQDYNGDGIADIAIYRPSNGLWAINWVGYAGYGMAGDIPVPGDYNGDGKTDIAIFRPSNGLWAIKDQGYFVHGMNGDWPVPAVDTNGDADPYQ